MNRMNSFLWEDLWFQYIFFEATTYNQWLGAKLKILVLTQVLIEEYLVYAETESTIHQLTI